MKNTFYHEAETKKRLCEFISKADKLSMGEQCAEFERKFAEYQGRKYAVLYNSGSSANLALIQSLLNLGLLEKGDNVGVSALTWATNVMPVMQLGLNPIPIDVSLNDLNVHAKNILNVKKRLKAIFLTNLLGFCGDINKIKDLCSKKGIILLEDNCESLGSKVNSKRLGNFGLASTFSFFVGHHLSTIEGGMVCTDDFNLYKMLKMVRAHGWARELPTWDKQKLKRKNKIEDFYDPYTFYVLGYNLRPTEITGFLGISQIEYLPICIRKRIENFNKFQKAASKNKHIKKISLIDMNFISNFAYPLIFKNKKSLEKYKARFKDKVEIRPIVSGAITNQPFFKNKKYNCPNAEKIHKYGFYLPNNPYLTKGEINEMCNLLK